MQQIMLLDNFLGGGGYFFHEENNFNMFIGIHFAHHIM